MSTRLPPCSTGWPTAAPSSPWSVRAIASARACSGKGWPRSHTRPSEKGASHQPIDPATTERTARDAPAGGRRRAYWIQRCWEVAGLSTIKWLAFLLTITRGSSRRCCRCSWRCTGPATPACWPIATPPSRAERACLQAAVVPRFSTVTGYPALDERIAKTRAHQRELLLVLKHPELPLPNNTSELAVRRRVRKRDVSFRPRTPPSLQGWATFHTLAHTAPA